MNIKAQLRALLRRYSYGLRAAQQQQLVYLLHIGSSSVYLLHFALQQVYSPTQLVYLLHIGAEMLVYLPHICLSGLAAGRLPQNEAHIYAA